MQYKLEIEHCGIYRIKCAEGTEINEEELSWLKEKLLKQPLMPFGPEGKAMDQSTFDVSILKFENNDPYAWHLTITPPSPVDSYEGCDMEVQLSRLAEDQLQFVMDSEEKPKGKIKYTYSFDKIDESKHPARIFGYTIPELVKAIGRLRYDSAAEIFESLSDEFSSQADADRKRGRKKLAGKLDALAEELHSVSDTMKEAWEICAPFMETCVKYKPSMDELKKMNLHHWEVWQGLPNVEFDDASTYGGLYTLIYEDKENYIKLMQQARMAYEENENTIFHVLAKNTLPGEIQTEVVNPFEGSLEEAIKQAKEANERIKNPEAYTPEEK